MVHKGDCTLECNGALGADRHKDGSPSKEWRMHYDVVIVGGEPPRVIGQGILDS